jgi:hypothetical protein
VAWTDNVSVERLRRRLEHKCIYLRAFERGSELQARAGGGSATTIPAPSLNHGRVHARRSVWDQRGGTPAA